MSSHLPPTVKRQRWGGIFTFATLAAAPAFYASGWAAWHFQIGGPLPGDWSTHWPHLLKGSWSILANQPSTEWRDYLALMLDPAYRLPWLSRAMITLTATVGAAIAGGRIVYVPGGRDDMRQTGGPVLSTGKQAVLIAQKSLAIDMGKDPMGWGIHIHPGIRLPMRREGQGILVMGAPGSGKTLATFGPMIKEAIERDDRALVYDTKGDFTSYFYQPTRSAIIAPWDARSVQWNIAADAPDRVSAELIAQQMIPESGKDPMWSNAARGVLTGCMVTLQQTKGRHWGWVDLAKTMKLPELEMIELFKDHAPFATPYVKETSKTTEGIMINLNAFTGWLDYLAIAWPNSHEGGISLRKWTRNDATKTRVLFVPSSDQYPFGDALASAIYAVAARTLLSMPDAPRRLWFFLDEFPRLPPVTEVINLIERGRSKGARVMLGVQDRSQIINRYTKEQEETIASMLATCIFMRVAATGETATWVSKSLGEKIMERPSSTIEIDGQGSKAGGSVSWQPQNMPVVTADEIASLPNSNPERGTYGYMRIAGIDGVFRLHWPGDPQKPICPAQVPAAWTLAPDERPEQPPTDTDTTPATGGRSLDPTTPDPDPIAPAPIAADPVEHEEPAPITATPAAGFFDIAEDGIEGASVADLMAESEPAERDEALRTENSAGQRASLDDIFGGLGR